MSSLPFQPNALLNAFTPAGATFDANIPDWPELIDPAARLDPAKHDTPVTLTLSAGAGTPVTFFANQNSQFTLSAKVGVTLKLDPIWPAGAVTPEFAALKESGFIADFAPGGGDFYLRFLCQATAQAAVNGSVPLGTVVKGSLGIVGSGDVKFERYKSYPAATAARTLVGDFFQTLASPLSVPPAPTAFPPDGEVIDFAYTGKLNFSAGLSAGYTVIGAETLKAGDFAPALRYEIKAQAKFDVGLTASGAFRFTLAASTTKPGWTRLRLNKANAVGATSGLGIELGLDSTLDNVPKNTEALLLALLGAERKDIIADVFSVFDVVRTEASFTQAMNKLTASYAPAWIERLAAPLIKATLDSSTYASFQGAVAFLGNLPKDARDHALALLDRHGLPPGEIASYLRLIEKADKDSAVQKLLTLSDAEAYKFIIKEYGDKFVEWFSEGIPAQVKTLAGNTATILETAAGASLAELAKILPLPANLKELLEKIVAAASPAAAKASLSEGATALATYLFGQLWSQLGNAQTVTPAWNKIHETAQGLQTLRTKLDQFLGGAQAAQARASFGLALGTTRSTEALLDLDIDTRSDSGRDLLRDALAGDLQALLKAAEVGQFVRVREGALQKATEAASTISIAALGWSFTRTVTKTQTDKIQVAPGDTGFLYLIDTTTAFATSSQKQLKDEIEQLSTRFYLQTQASAPSAEALKVTLKNVTAGYELKQSDTRTTTAELADYLGFAKEVGLLGPASFADYLAELQAAYFAAPGATPFVKVEYVIKYSPDALRDAFKAYPAADRSELLKDAKATVRKFFSLRYVKANPDRADADLIEDYLRSTRIVPRRKTHGGHAGGNNQIPKTTLYFADGSNRLYANSEAGLLERFHEEEEAFLRALDGLATQLALPQPDKAALDLAASGFVNVAQGTPLFGSRLWRDNVFFLVVDALIRTTGHRKAMLAITVLKADGTDDKHHYLAS